MSHRANTRILNTNRPTHAQPVRHLAFPVEHTLSLEVMAYASGMPVSAYPVRGERRKLAGKAVSREFRRIERKADASRIAAMLSAAEVGL